MIQQAASLYTKTENSPLESHALGNVIRVLSLMRWHLISLLPGDSWGDVVFALVVVSIPDEILAHILHLAASEGRTVVKSPVQDSRLPRQQFNQLSHLTESDAEKCNNASAHSINLTPSWHQMWILWVRLDYTCTPRGGTGSLRMTDFNNSTEVAPRGPLTPSHKRKHLLSFHSQAAETSSRAKHFWVLSMTTRASKHAAADNFSSKDRSSFFYSVGHKKQPEAEPSFMSFTFSTILQFRCTVHVW